MRNPLRQRSLKFKRSSDANVEGKRNFLGNVTNIDGKLYFYGANWVARSANGKQWKLLHEDDMPGDLGIAKLGDTWHGIEAH